jgi:hypothetical protein
MLAASLCTRTSAQSRLEMSQVRKIIILRSFALICHNIFLPLDPDRTHAQSFVSDPGQSLALTGGPMLHFAFAHPNRAVVHQMPLLPPYSSLASSHCRCRLPLLTPKKKLRVNKWVWIPQLSSSRCRPSSPQTVERCQIDLNQIGRGAPPRSGHLVYGFHGGSGVQARSTHQGGWRRRCY